MSYPRSVRLDVDLDTGAEYHAGWSDGDDDPVAVEVRFERKDPTDGLYHCPLSRVVVDQKTGRLIEFEYHGPDAVEEVKRKYYERELRLAKLREPGLV